MAERGSFIDPKVLIEGDFFKEASLENLPEEEKKKLMTKMIDGVKNRVLIRIDDMIAEADKAQFQELLDKGDDEAINKFLKEKKISVPQLVVEESLLQKQQLIQALAKLKSQEGR